MMRPNDENGQLPTAERPFRVLIIAGSNRRQYNCPGVDSKARTLMLRMAERLPQQWEIDYEDLGNVYGRARIQSCNACVSTSMALCVWPCNCYEKNNKKEPDLLWDLDMYARLDLADAWAIIGPINWYAPTSNLKLRGSHYSRDGLCRGTITSFTRSLSQALADKCIRVNGVAPGPVWTPLIPSTFPAKEVETFGSDVPLGRAGQPEEIAPSYVFLASDDSSYMTGQILHPNGGTVVNG
jgi:NAD(P)-dependent dehydrogenase (short-subunit alcohol dehydrogenase family)